MCELGLPAVLHLPTPPFFLWREAPGTQPRTQRTGDAMAPRSSPLPKPGAGRPTTDCNVSALHVSQALRHVLRPRRGAWPMLKNASHAKRSAALSSENWRLSFGCVMGRVFCGPYPKESVQFAAMNDGWAHSSFCLTRVLSRLAVWHAAQVARPLPRRDRDARDGGVSHATAAAQIEASLCTDRPNGGERGVALDHSAVLSAGTSATSAARRSCTRTHS